MPKLTEYNQITSISGSSILLYGVDISGGSPAYGKISGSNLGPAISGDMYWTAIQASQLVNEIKGFPPVVNTGDLDALNLWWDKIGTPTTAPSVFNTSGCGITDNYKLCLGVVADASGEGFYQRFTYADEPRVKSGRKLSTLWAIWCVDGVGVTLSLTNSDASETAAAKVTAAAWTIVEVPNHTLAGTYVDVKILADGAGTFYAVPLGTNTGVRGIPLKPRGLRYVDYESTVVVNDVDPGATWTTADFTAATSSLATKVHVYCIFYSTLNSELCARRKGDTRVGNAVGIMRAAVVSVFFGGVHDIPVNDLQELEYIGSSTAGHTEHVYMICSGHWEWE